MPFNLTRSREIGSPTCLLGILQGRGYVESMVFDATTLTPDGNGRYYVPIGTLLTRSVANDPTKVKAYQALGTNVNAVQTITITGTPTGGTFTLTYLGQTTTPIAFNASAATVQAALVALTNIGTGNVAGAGGALPGTPVTATFQGTLGNQPVALMTASGAGLTGGTTPAVAVTTTTPGQTAEAIIGVYDGPDRDFFGNTVGSDEPIPVYNAFCAFDLTQIVNWTAYSAAAQSALPTCTFRTP